MFTSKETRVLRKASKIIFNKPPHKIDMMNRLFMVDHFDMMEWVAGDNVIRIDGYLTTQDSNYNVKITTLEELENYYYKHIKF